MATDTVIRRRVGNALVVPLTDLVNASSDELKQSEEFEDASLQYILVDVRTFEQDFTIRDPIGRILDYASIAKERGKTVVVFNVGDCLDRNLSLSGGYKAFCRLGVYATFRGFDETIAEYCNNA